MSSATTTEPKCSHPRAIRPRSATCADFALAAGLKHPAAGPGERERQIAQRVSNDTLTGEAQIGLAVGAVWNRYQVKKHGLTSSSMGHHCRIGPANEQSTDRSCGLSQLVPSVSADRDGAVDLPRFG